MSQRWLRWSPVLVAAATFAVFVPALANQFVNWDDYSNFLSNPHFRGLGWRNLRWMFSTYQLAHYQPLSWMTLGADYLVWGLNPFGYHLTSILIHSANAVLVYFLFLRLAPSRGSAAAAFAALFFSLHPLRVESVAWATERRDVLSGFFYLVTVHLYLRKRLAAAWAACLLAMLAKVTSLTIPGVLLLLDIYPLGRLPWRPTRWLDAGPRRILAEKIPFLAIALALAVVGLKAQASSPALVALSEAGPLHRVGQALYGLGFYAWKTVWPSRLSPWYGASLTLDFWPSVLPAAGGAALGIFALSQARRRPWLAACWLLYAAALFPMLGLVKSGRQLVADRYSYLACLPWAFLLGAGLSRAPRPAFWAAAAWLAFLGIATRSQIDYWHDTQSLWRRALAVNPRSSMANISLAVSYLETGRYETTVSHVEAQLRIHPKGEMARLLRSVGARAGNNLGVDLSAKGRIPEAVVQFEKSLAWEELPETVNNLGLALAGRGDWSGARGRFQRALELWPSYAEARANLGVSLGRLGLREEGRKELLRALDDDPGLERARSALRALPDGR